MADVATGVRLSERLELRLTKTMVDAVIDDAGHVRVEPEGGRDKP